MQFPPLLNYALALGSFLKYPLIALGAPFGGPLFILACGFFLHEGLLGFPEILIAIIAGDLAMDSFWYGLGYRYGDGFVKRYGGRFGFTASKFESAKTFFGKHGILILFLAKLSAGLGFIQLIFISAGAARIRFWKFLTVNATGEIVWTSCVLYLGYRYADLYATARNDFKVIALTGTLVVLLPVTIWASRFLRKRALKDL